MISYLGPDRLPDERNGHYLGNTATTVVVKSRLKIAVKKHLETKTAEYAKDVEKDGRAFLTKCLFRTRSCEAQK
jgi:hypothetical protein